MAKKPKKTTPAAPKQMIHVEGGIHAGRDVIQGNQYNYAPRDIQVANITTPAEFSAKLIEIQAEIVQLRQQSNLNAKQATRLEAAEKKVAKAVDEAQKPDANVDVIEETLTDAKDKFELLSGGLEAAIKLGKTLATVIGFAKIAFGV